MANRENLEKIYFRIIEWGTYLALFTPFIFIRDYFFPFVVPKTIFFRVVVDVIFIAYILLVLSNRKYLPKFTPLTIALTVFLGVVIFTSIVGVNFTRSFWSVFERMTGILTFLHLYVFFIILSSVFKERKYWERILTVSILVGALICLYAITSEEAVTRGGGTLGNTSFLSAYLLFDIFFAMVLLLVKTNIWRIFYGITLIIFLYTFFFNTEPTQGAIGAFAGGIFVLGFGYLMFYLLSSGKKKLKWLSFLFVVLIILAGIGFFQLNFAKGKITEIWQSNSLQSRLVVWKMGLQAWQEKPWFGWGQENFNIPFAKYFDPRLPLTQDIWYDRVHNVVLDTGVTSGILGLISYLSIFGVAIYGLFRVLPKITERKNIVFPLGMISLLLVYFVQNIWVFDMISSYMVLFLSLAFINFLISRREENSQTVLPEKSNSLYSLFGAVLIIVVVSTLYFGNMRVAEASRLTVRGLSLPLEQSLPAFQKALTTSPISQFETVEQLSTRIVALASQQNQNKELLDQGLKSAEDELKDSIAKNPLDFRLQLFLGKFYNNLYQLSGDKAKLDLADEWLKKAGELSPKNEQVYWSLAQTRISEAKLDEAIEFVKKSVELEPRLGQSHWYLALTYRIAGKYDLAVQEANEAERLGYKWRTSADDIKQMVEVYKALGDNVNALSLLETAVSLNPQDYQLWANLADIYSTLGEKEKAKNAAEKISELKPEMKPQVDEFLKALGY